MAALWLVVVVQAARAARWAETVAACAALLLLGATTIALGAGAAWYRRVLRDAQRQSIASRDELQNLIDNTSAVIYMKRIDNGQYVLVNREWERLFGVTRDRVVNLTDREVFPAVLAEQLRANDLGVAEAGRTVQYEESADVGDETRTYVSVKFPVADADGHPYAVCGISTDITQRKRAESEVLLLNGQLETRVRERTAELEASTRELDAFAYSVSHDLRAPLRALYGFSDALLEDYGDEIDDDGKTYLRRIQHNVRRMGNMIDDLLNLSRATRVELVRNAVDITAIARDVLADLAATEPARRVDTVIAENLCGYGDSQLVHMVMQNLLGNAWKFTSHRDIATIEVGRSSVDGEVMFFVRDNGAGFDMRYADKLFTAFQRLHPVAEFEGTGIGLAIVARIVHRHGGRITADADIDRGATFWFSLTSHADIATHTDNAPSLEGIPA
jgi:PAS domain S-box-containing protein